MRRIIVQAIILIVLLTGVSIAAIYFTEASISYSLDVYTYQKTGNNWYSIFDGEPSVEGTISSVHLENRGMFEGSFKLIVKLTNASFVESSFNGSKLVNESEAVLFFTLKPQQEIDRSFYFNVTESNFVISIDLQSDQLFLRSTVENWGNQNIFHYGSMDNCTWIPPLLS